MADKHHRMSPRPSVATAARAGRPRSLDANMEEVGASGDRAGDDARYRSELTYYDRIKAKSFRQFLDDLPALLEKKRNHKKLVAYYDGQQLLIAPSMSRILEYCECNKLSLDEVMIECIAPQPEAIMEAMRQDAT